MCRVRPIEYRNGYIDTLVDTECAGERCLYHKIGLYGNGLFRNTVSAVKACNRNRPHSSDILRHIERKLLFFTGSDRKGAEVLDNRLKPIVAPFAVIGKVFGTADCKQRFKLSAVGVHNVFV